MYIRLKKYLKDQNILYAKKFGFQVSHTTGHVIAQLNDQICESLEKNEYTPGVFIDLSKAFNTVDQSMLLRKIEVYILTDMNMDSVSPLNRLHYIRADENYRTESYLVTCNISQVFVLGLVLFLLHVNDLKNASPVQDPIMFADSTNYPFTRSNVQKLFSTVNQEPASISQWFVSNKLSLKSKEQNIPLSINSVK